MTSEKRNSQYYVVGGPVQPGRACCVLRDSDMQLYARLIEGEYCHVFAPSHEGKTTLMAQTANRLREEGIRVATIDLAQISSRDMKDDVGRWYYSFAYRIVRELRIRSDLQSWWQERAGLTIMQRLREFFLDVVLAESDDRVVIFIDRIESALGQAIARQLLSAIRACHDARATEPNYRRLTFALLGSVSVGQRIPDGHRSPFDISTEIELDDFQLPELRRLAAGLGADQQTASRITQAVWNWTAGQPYLSQKIMRALARRSSEELNEALVDDVVATLFLTPRGPRDEPHLSAVARELLRESPGRDARLGMFRRIRKGRRVIADPGLDVHRDLLLTGAVVIAPDGAYAMRNRIYAQAFTPQWIGHNQPFGWKRLGVAASIALICVAAPIWYTKYLPQPYIEDLTAANMDYVSVLDSYRRLAFLPGFGDMADNLFADYLVRQSRRARRLAEVERFSESLAEIPGRQDLAREVLAEFWGRRVESSMHRGERDEALLYAMRALDDPTPERRRVAAELLGDDFGMLQGTVRTTRPLRAIELDAEAGLVAALDSRHRVDVWHVTDGGPQRVQRLALLAEEVIPLQRRLVHEGGVKGRRLVLTVRTDHPRPTDISIDIRAPSGREVMLGIDPDTAGAGDGVFRFDSRRTRPLAALLDGNIEGTWSADFVDHVQGVIGNLVSWEIRIDDKPAAPPVGANPETSEIPEPGVARQIHSVLSPGGRRALTWPADPLVRGDVLVWDIADGEILARLPRPANFTTAEFALGHDAVFITAGSSIEFHELATGKRLVQMQVEPVFAPVLSGNGRFLVVDTVLRAGDNALSVWDIAAAEEIGRLVTGNVADLVAPGPHGRFMAVSDGDRLVRLWSVRDGRLIGEYEHSAKPTGIGFDASGRWLMTQDAAFGFRVWPVSGTPRPVVSRRGSSAWTADTSGNWLLLGSLDRGYELIDLITGRAKGSGFAHGIPASRKSPEVHVPRALLATGHGFAATYDGRRALKAWRLPPQLTDSVGSASGARALRDVSGAAAISPDGRQLALATEDGEVQILPADRQALVLPDSGLRPSFIGHLDPIVITAFGASGNLVASGSLEGGIRVWEAATGAPRSFFAGHGDGAVHDIVISADDSLVFSASRRSVIVIDAVTGDLLAQTPIQAEKPQLAVSDDGQRVYIAGDRDGVTRWLWRGGIVESLIAPDSGICRVAVSPDETVLVTASARRQVQLWDMASMVPREHDVRTAAAVDHLSIAPDGSRVLAQSGVWLHLLATAADGLRHEATRLLNDAPAAVVTADAGLEAFVLLRPSVSTPIVERLAMATPATEPLNVPRDQLIADIESRFSLTLDKWGDARPLSRR